MYTIMILTVFLTAVNILWPIAGVSVLIVQKTTNAELLRSSSVPACPIAGAGRLVAEDAVQPIAVLRADWWIWKHRL